MFFQQIVIQLKCVLSWNICAKRNSPSRCKRPELRFFQSMSVLLVYFCNTVFLIPILWSWFRYLAATLVINWLSSHEDPTLQRMAVAVISILVAKVKTLLTYCALVCSRKIMWHLLVLADKSPMPQSAPVPLWHWFQQPALCFHSVG